MEITLIKSHELDRPKWDKFILSSPQGFIYGLSDYLEIVSPEWEALICRKGDAWLAVMPWFAKKKYGIKYVFQPAFCQFQGIYFSPLANDLSHQRRIGFLYSEIIKRSCHVFQINFSGNIIYPFPFIWSGFSVHPMINYRLPLKAGEQLESNFNEGHRKQIKKALRDKLNYTICSEVEDTISLFKQNKDSKQTFMSEKNYNQIRLIHKNFRQKKMSFIIECKSNEGLLLASIMLLKFKETMIFLFGTVSEEGKKHGAMVFTFLKSMEFATDQGCNMFDFEGSMIESIELFFRKFGAQPQTYWKIRKTPFTALLRRFV
jgi:hypothetical protein